MDARDEVLARVRAALGDAPRAARPVPRGYDREDSGDPQRWRDLLAERLRDYRAEVSTCPDERLGEVLADALTGVPRLVVPPDVPPRWLAGYPGSVLVDDPPAPVSALDAADAVLTGCAVAIATTGTIVLDAGAAQGRRALTLVPDRHICVVRGDQVVAGVPAALRRLDATRPLTFISGPSATSDIELSRVEGVHGPRRLHVILVD
jgi:L-lactate dehydrogenase complex protein LldG